MKQAAKAVEENYDLPPEPPSDEMILTAPPVSEDPIAVVFVGDVLTARQKFVPQHRMGGKFFPETVTLPNRIVSRCAITRLRKSIISYPKAHVEKDKWGLWLQGYEATQQWNRTTKKYETVKVGNIPGAKPGTQHLLFKERYPSQDIGGLIREEMGIVPIPNNSGILNSGVIKAAQLHFFPNWHDIAIGNDKFPATLRELEDYLENRTKLADNPAFKAVGSAYLRSCTEFRLWGTNFVKLQTDAIEEFKGKGRIQYDEVAENLMQMLEITRKDSLVEGFAKGQNDNAAIQSQLLDLQKQNVEMQGQLTSAFTMLAQALNRDAGKVETLVATSGEQPAPTTKAEVDAEIDRNLSDEVKTTVPVKEDEVFTDMSDEQVDQIFDQENKLNNDE